MKYRKLRIAWSTFFGILCLSLIVLWVRGYWWTDVLYYRSGPGSLKQVMAHDGIVAYLDASEFVRGRMISQPTGWSVESWRPAKLRLPQDSDVKFDTLRPSIWGRVFREFGRPAPGWWQVPMWFLTLIAGGLIIVPYAGWSKRFSLRTLLAAMTLIAVGLGWIVYASK